jgi:hypothetical protein
MNRGIGSKTQYSRGEQVPITRILETLSEAVYTTVGLKPVMFEELNELRLHLIFTVCHRQYHDDHSGLKSRTERCELDVRDFLAGNIDLPRYVVCAFEQGLRLGPTQIEMVRGLEAAPGTVEMYTLHFVANAPRLPSVLRTDRIRRSFPKSVIRFVAWCKAMCRSPASPRSIA